VTEDPIVISLDSATCCVGDAVTGVVWLRDTPRVAEAEEMRVFFELRATTSDGTENRSSVGLRGPVNRELRFCLTLPASGPISWTGKQIALEWWVVAELVTPSAWEQNLRTQLKLEVLPRGATSAPHLRPDGVR
jgi:hypothetical protein